LFSCINVERELHRSIVNQGQCHDFSSSAKLIKNGIAPLPFPLPALLKQYWYIKRGERVRVRGHAPFYATLGSTLRGPPWSRRFTRVDRCRGTLSRAARSVACGENPSCLLHQQRPGRVPRIAWAPSIANVPHGRQRKRSCNPGCAGWPAGPTRFPACE